MMEANKADSVNDEHSMNAAEMGAFMKFSDDLVKQVDPMTFISCLYRIGHIDDKMYAAVRRLFQEGSSRACIMERVVKRLPYLTSFPELVFCLDNCGYHRLAARIFLCLIQSTEQLHHLHKVGIRERAKHHKFSRNLKRMVHDAQFKNPRQALRAMAQRFRAQLEAETDIPKRQYLADTCIAILGVEVDAQYDSLACRMEITQEDILEEMRQIVPSTSNPLIADIVYYSRYANLDACHGHFKHADNMLIQARSSAYNIGSCLEIINMLYIEVYVKLWEFENEPSQALLDAIMMWGRIGLESLENVPSETKEIWSRMFILRMVFAMLGIGNRANIISTTPINSGSLQTAQSLLANIDTQWSGIETRREMFYCVARARLFEQLSQYSDAKMYIQRAKVLAEHGQFIEKIPFIDAFAEVIDTQMCTSKVARTDRRVGSCVVERHVGYQLKTEEVFENANASDHKSRTLTDKTTTNLYQPGIRQYAHMYATDPLKIHTSQCFDHFTERYDLPQSSFLDKPDDFQMLNKCKHPNSISQVFDEPPVDCSVERSEHGESKSDASSGLSDERQTKQCVEPIPNFMGESGSFQDSITRLKETMAHLEQVLVIEDPVENTFQELTLNEPIFPHDKPSKMSNESCNNPMLDKSHCYPLYSNSSLADSSYMNSDADSCTQLKLANTHLESQFCNLQNHVRRHRISKIKNSCLTDTHSQSTRLSDESANNDHHRFDSTKSSSTELSSEKESITTQLRGICHETIRFPSVVLFESRGEAEGTSRETIFDVESSVEDVSRANSADMPCMAQSAADVFHEHFPDYVDADDFDENVLFGDG